MSEKTALFSLATINRTVAALLVTLAVMLIAVVLWGLQQLQATYDSAHDYYRVRESLSGHWRSTIENYLHGGDGVQLDAAIKQLTEIRAQSLATLPQPLQEKLLPQMAALAEHRSARSGQAGGPTAGTACQCRKRTARKAVASRWHRDREPRGQTRAGLRLSGENRRHERCAGAIGTGAGAPFPTQKGQRRRSSRRAGRAANAVA